MKFLPDPNPKKVRISAETPAEEAWLSTKSAASHRINKGDERFVVAAFTAWCHGTVPAKQSADQRASLEKRERRIAALDKEVMEWAFRLSSDLDVKEGLTGKAEVGALVCKANELARISGRSLFLSGIPWPRRPAEIIAQLG